jgi:hypothetical protein
MTSVGVVCSDVILTYDVWFLLVSLVTVAHYIMSLSINGLNKKAEMRRDVVDLGGCQIFPNSHTHLKIQHTNRFSFIQLFYQMLHYSESRGVVVIRLICLILFLLSINLDCTSDIVSGISLFVEIQYRIWWSPSNGPTPSEFPDTYFNISVVRPIPPSVSEKGLVGMMSTGLLFLLSARCKYSHIVLNGIAQ